MTVIVIRAVFFFFFAVKLIDDRNTLISCAACNAVGEIGRGGALPLPDGHAVTQQGKDKGRVYAGDIYSAIVVRQSPITKTSWNLGRNQQRTWDRLVGQDKLNCRTTTIMAVCAARLCSHSNYTAAAFLLD